MTRSFHRRFLRTSLLALTISLIVIPAASAMPVLSDSTRTAPTAQQPLADSWYTPAVLGSTQSFSIGRSTPDLPPVSTSAPVISSPSGFDWNNAGLGIAFGAALIALMAFGAHRARRARQVPILH
jgi:hypothetical protein